MEKIKNPEAKILSMKIYDTKDQISEEKKKQVRLEKLNTYQKYQKFEKMMKVYNRYQHTKNFTNILKNIDPTIALEKFFKDEGLNNEPNIDDEYRTFTKVIRQVKSENPDIDLNDITSQDSRAVMSNVINRTQQGKELTPADLDFVAVIEGFGLYGAMTEIRAGVDREAVKKKYNITEEMLQKGEDRKQSFEQKDVKDIYERVNKGKVNEVVFIAAGALEIAPGEAQVDLESFGVIESKKKEKEPITEECLLVNRKEPALNVMDAFYKKLNEYAPNKTNMEMVKESIDDYLNEIEEWNKTQEEEEKKFRRNHDGKPSPRFLRELKEYEKQQAKEQAQIQNTKIAESGREIG